MTIDEILKISPFSLNKENKEKLLTARLTELTKQHIRSCPEYAAMMRAVGFSIDNCDNYYDIPFLPVSLFKELELKSIPQEDIFKVTMSSGTTGQTVSKIYLDREATAIQQKVLAKIVSEFIGAKRMPMLIIDNQSALKNRAAFSARGAGIAGFSMFGTDKVYALNNDMELDISLVEAFLDKHRGERVLLFGFTFMVWQHLHKQLQKLGRTLDLSRGILIHGGGWKKLAGEAVTKDDFKKQLAETCNISEIHDYYGMVEQTGTIYMECKEGYLHTSIFSDIITRRHLDFAPCNIGESGIVQVVSTLPESYPGHSLLTEDEGVILGEDDCKCGRFGKFFQINGRLKMAEIRGCSDTYADSR